MVGTPSPDEASVKGSASTPLTFYAHDIKIMTITTGGNVGIGVTNPSAKLEINGDARFGCRSGFWAIGEGRLCMDSTLRGPGTMHAAIAACKALSPSCRVCEHTDFQQACGAGFSPYGAASGWYGDHGVISGGNWDDEFGTWNVNGCADNNDGPASDALATSVNYRCCY